MQSSNFLSNQTENLTVSKPAIWDADFRVLQPFWDLRLGYEYYIESPLFPIVVSILFYFMCILPWMVIDLWGKNWHWIRKYKIRPDVDVAWPQIKNAIVLTMWNQVLFLLPISVAQWMFDKPMFLPQLAPTLWEVCWQITVALMIFDLEYFVWHSSHHKIRFLYKHVHSLHHQYHACNSWVTQYLHPYELISVGIFTATSPRFFDVHPLTYLLFQQVSIVVSVEDHIGYDLPFAPHHLFSFWGGAIKHEMHHQKPLTNFAPFYNWWDKLFGWYCPGQLAGGVRPKALLDWEKRQRELKAEKKAKQARKEEQKNGIANGHSNGHVSNGYQKTELSNGTH